MSFNTFLLHDINTKCSLTTCYHSVNFLCKCISFFTDILKTDLDFQRFDTYCLIDYFIKIDDKRNFILLSG